MSDFPPTPLDILAPENCVCDMDAHCVCPTTERALRMIQDRQDFVMTPDQREWCLTEIAKVEGYSRADHENEAACDLARSVMSSWVDYCRDKGLL